MVKVIDYLRCVILALLIVIVYRLWSESSDFDLVQERKQNISGCKSTMYDLNTYKNTVYYHTH